MDDLEKLLQEGSADEKEVTTAEKEEKSMAVRQEVRKATNGGVAKFASEIRGKLSVLFGQPLTGKTTLAHVAAKHFERCVYFRIDRNFNVRDFDAKNVYYITINSPKHLLYELNKLIKSPPAGDALIVVDSLTSLDSYFMPDDPTKQSPLSDKLRARFADAVMQRLAMLKDRGCTVLTIAHERLKDFESKETVPRFNIVALRHADVIYRLTVENGKRKVQKVAERRPPSEPQFEFS